MLTRSVALFLLAYYFDQSALTELHAASVLVIKTQDPRGLFRELSKMIILFVTTQS